MVRGVEQLGETASDSVLVPYSTGQLGHRTVTASVSSLLRHSYALLKVKLVLLLNEKLSSRLKLVIFITYCNI